MQPHGRAGSPGVISPGSLCAGPAYLLSWEVFPLEDIISVFVPLIQNVGFPIACVFGMFYFWNKERMDHKEELKAVTEAVTNNTLALQRLSDKLSHD